MHFQERKCGVIDEGSSYLDRIFLSWFFQTEEGVSSKMSMKKSQLQWIHCLYSLLFFQSPFARGRE